MSLYYDKLCDLGIKLTRHGGSEKTRCPQCSDSRKNKADKPLSVNITNGDFHCHHCGWKGNVRKQDRKHEAKVYERPPADVLKSIQLAEKIESYFKSRGISKSTLEKFMIFSKEEWMPQTQKKENCICFPYFRDGELVNIKFRDAKKGFKMIKGAELIFYNLQAVADKTKCIIVEGEVDCLSVYEVGYGQIDPIDKASGELQEELSKWVVLSVPNGASKGDQQLEYLDNCADWFSNFQDIIVATDGDAAGASLRDELIRRLGVERCYTVNYPIEEVVPTSNGFKRRCKDFNEVLMYLGRDVVINTIKNAESIPVDGIYYLEDLFPTMLENFRRGVQLAPTTRFRDMDDFFRWKKGELNLFVGYGNHGKALDVNTDIATDYGWKKMGQMEIGDKVFDENGNLCNVTYVTPIMHNRICYKVVFSDNSEVICDEEHLWFTHTEASRLSEKSKIRNSKIIRPKGTNQEYKRVRPKIRTTKEILLDLYNFRKDGRRHNKHSIDIAKPLNLPQVFLSIHPYVLGVWLGDGCSSSASLTCNDSEIIDMLEFYGIKTVKRKAKFIYGLGSGLIYELKKFNLIKNKHIPNEYLRASVSQRLDLLKGLMDTDGHIDKTRICEFTTIRKDLCNQVYELITSLGFKASIYEGNATLNGRIIGRKYRICFKPNVCVFNLSRKAIRHADRCKNNWRYIQSITPVESVPVRCITVDSPNSLYLCTKSYIPTHNTFFALQLMLTKSIWDHWRWAVFSPENYPAYDFYDDMVEMYAGKWLKDMTEEEYTTACNFISDHIFYVYPEDEHDVNSINERFRYLVLKKGVDGVMIDPFNQLDHLQKPYQREDQYLSEMFKDLKRFALLNNVCYNIIAHPKNPVYNQDKSLPVVDMYDIAGGAAWGNKMDQIISYYRPNFHVDKNDPNVQIYIQKLKRKRTGGRLGDFPLVLDWSKKRYKEPVSGFMPCDPELAAGHEKRNSEGGPSGWLPYKDDLFNDDPF